MSVYLSVCLTDKQGRAGAGQQLQTAQGRAGQQLQTTQGRAGQGKQFFIFGCSSKNICNMNLSEHPDTMSTLFFCNCYKKNCDMNSSELSDIIPSAANFVFAVFSGML